MTSYKGWIKKQSGTSFLGYVHSTYGQIVKTFGEPVNNGDEYKVDTEWIIDTPYGVATIYNYKDGKAYLGEKGTDVTLISEWHIGGKNIKAYTYVKKTMEAYISNAI